MNQAAQVLIALLPIVSVVIVGVLSFFYLLWEYRKIRMIIERGEKLPPSRYKESLLLVGIVALCVGLGLILYFLLKGGITDALLGGLMPAATGLGIIIFYCVAGGGKRTGGE